MNTSPPQLPLEAKSKKSKSSVHFAPVNLKIGSEDEKISNIEIIVKEIIGEFKCLIDDFINSRSTDNQITIMKNIIDLLKDKVQVTVVHFIVIVLFESEPRHPVKCLIMRHLERWTDIQEMFTQLLSKQIMSYYHTNKEFNYEKQNFIISRLGSCLENFALGFQSVKLIENDVIQMLLLTLTGCLNELKTQISPEEKLNVLKLMHQTLRLLLLLFPKASVDKTLNDNIRTVISQLIECPDVTVDNKSLCAMLDIAVLKCEDKHPWDKFRECPDVLLHARVWCTNDTNLLCFYYALFTTAPSNVIDLLDNEYTTEAKQAFHDIVQKVVDITDKMSNSVDGSMAGGRTVAIIANRLAAASGEMDSNKAGSNEPESKKSRSNEQGSNNLEANEESKKSESNESTEKNTREPSLRVALLVERSLTSLGAHVSAAPRQLAAQAQPDLLHYYLQHHPLEGTRWLSCGDGGAAALSQLRLAAGAGGRAAGALRAAAPPARLLPALAGTDTMLQASSLLTTYITLDCECLEAELVHQRWVEPAISLLVSRPDLKHDTLDHLVALLATAVDLNDSLLDYILPLIKRPEATHPDNRKCTLFLMHVILKSKAGKKYQDTEDKWKGIITFDVVGHGILNSDDEQVVSMALSAGLRGGGPGGLRTAWCLLISHAHRPVATHTRTLDLIQHLFKRVESEYLTAMRKGDEGDKNQNCLQLLERLRHHCFENLLPGGNHYRRGVSLFILKQIHSLQLGYHWSWIQPQVDTVLRHIEDTYDRNRHTAFEILKMCPRNLVKDGMASNGMTSIDQIVSTCGARARDASGAALRVELLLFIAGALSPEQVTPEQTSSEPLSPEQASAEALTLEQESAEALSFEQESAEALSLEQILAEVLSPEQAPPEALSPEQASAKALSHEQASATALSPEQASAEVLSPEQASAKDLSPEQASAEALPTEQVAAGALDSQQVVEPSSSLDRDDEAVESGDLNRQLVAEKCLKLAQSGPGRASALHILYLQLKHLPLSSCIWSPAEELALKVLDLAAPLVQAASPEGYVPDTFFDTPVKPHPESKHLFIVGDEVMTSQTMLLYAWTSAKEAWAILCAVGAALGARRGLLAPLAGRLLRVRHRALLDHAAAAYAALLQHYHTNKHTMPESEEINEAFDQIERVVREEILSSGDSTRRGAGLTALGVALAGLGDSWCRRIAAYVTEGIRKKCHTAPHIAAALLRAKKLHRNIHRELQHFMLAAFDQLDDPNTEMQWSCASVISAGVRRALGPSGPGGVTGPSLRMSVFVARYPLLYQRIVECVQAGRAASLVCALVALGRLRGGAPPPALLEGVARAARSPSHHVRRLAATAAASILPQNMYLEHAAEVLNNISEPNIVKNLCHGLILRLIALVESAPELQWSDVFAPILTGTLWIMETGCYPLIHEYINLSMLLLDKCPGALVEEYRSALGSACGRVARGGAGPGPGRAAGGAAAVRGAAALLPPARRAAVLDAALRCDTYEMCLAALECYLSTPTLRGFIDPAQLCVLYTSHPHPECRRLSLKLLVENNLIEHILEEPPSNITNMDVYNWRMLKLYEKWENAVENERALFIEGIRRTLTAARESGSGNTTDEDTQEEDALHEDTQSDTTLGDQAARAVATAIFASSALTADQEERDAADALLQEHGDCLLDSYDEDNDDLLLPVCIFGAYARQVEGRRRVGGRAALLRRTLDDAALLLALALLDFAVPAQEPDETSQYRAFERSWDPELAEEGLWTAACGARLALAPALAALGRHRAALRHVAGDNLDHFHQLVLDPGWQARGEHVNPKVVYLVKELRTILVRVPNDTN